MRCWLRISVVCVTASVVGGCAPEAEAPPPRSVQQKIAAVDVAERWACTILRGACRSNHRSLLVKRVLVRDGRATVEGRTLGARPRASISVFEQSTNEGWVVDAQRSLRHLPQSVRSVR